MPRRVVASMQAAFVLFATSAIVGAVVLRMLPPLRPGVFLLAMAIPAISALVVMVLGISIDGILPERGIRFPSNLTLPIMHAALMAVMVQLIATSSNPLELVPDQLFPALLWFNPLILGICGVLEVMLLSLLMVALPKK